MARIARVVVPGCPHHVTQRGNNRERVFFSNQDYIRYLALIKKHSEQYQLTILGYCLMPNHIHFIATPKDEESMQKTFGRVHWKYAQIINRRLDRCGHLWQARFFSCPLDGAHLVAAMAYVERNPVRSGLVDKPWEHQWSSAAAHVNGFDENELVDPEEWKKIILSVNWKNFLNRGEKQADLDRLRKHTRNGRPLGEKSFIEKLERKSGRHLRPSPVGRPYIKEIN